MRFGEHEAVVSLIAPCLDEADAIGALVRTLRELSAGERAAVGRDIHHRPGLPHKDQGLLLVLLSRLRVGSLAARKSRDFATDRVGRLWTSIAFYLRMRTDGRARSLRDTLAEASLRPNFANSPTVFPIVDLMVLG
jgi:hypothetical protein